MFPPPYLRPQRSSIDRLSKFALTATAALLLVSTGGAIPLKVDIDGNGGSTAAGWVGWDPVNPNNSALDTGVGNFAASFATDGTTDVRITTSSNSYERNYGIGKVIGAFSAATPAELWQDQYFFNQAAGGPLVITLNDLQAGFYSFTIYNYYDNLNTSGHASGGTAITDIFVNGIDSSFDATAYGGNDTTYATAFLEANVSTVEFEVLSNNDTVTLEFRNPTANHFGLNGFQLDLTSPPPPPLVLGQVVISEFMASNNSALLDGDGNSSDWIEIWNSTDAPVNMSGWSLTDDAGNLTKWPFPAITLQPDEYRLVFASGQLTDTYVDGGGFLHTNFVINKAAGGYLALVDGAQQIVDEYITYPGQEEDISYGLFGTEAPLSTGYLSAPSPGGRNSLEGFLGFVSDTTFDHDRGFYDAPFDLIIMSATDGATIRYTTDGSEPSETIGADYPGGTGIAISGTTIIRAAAFKEGFQPTNIDTHTYLFVDDVVNQPANPPGFSTAWTGSDYAMEDNAAHLALIAGNAGLTEAQAKTVIADALLELPTMSLSMHVDDWFSPASGIYHNSTSEGGAWERACSAELIHPPGIVGEGEGDFQIDCGIRVQGFTSRDPTRNPKHSLRLAFRGQYGAPKLRYKFFGDDAPDEFDTIVLRSNSQDAWVYNSSANRAGQFIRDAWARKTHRAMGHASPDSNWVHLFINGLYWGVYNPTERPDSAHSAAYYGGNKDNYDALKNHEEVLDGTDVAYKELLALIQNDPNNFGAGYRDLSGAAEYEAVLAVIDVDMLIDYMIHNMYAAATDWPGNNYVGYDRTGAHGGWRFYDWDNEHGMKHSVGTNRTTTHSRDNDSPTKFHHALRSNAEYRQRFGDRLHKAMFNGGVLYVDPANPAWDPAHPGRNVPAARWMELTGEIETALIAESARWGDYRQSTPYTVFNEFQSVRNSLLSGWFPTRSSVVLGQFRSQGLYPSFAAPEFGQFGGVVAPGFGLTMNAPDGGTIHYTLDGSDPQDSGTVYSAAVPLTATGEVRARVEAGGEWSALTAASFIVGTPASAANLVVSEIMYHPVGGTSHEYIELMNISATETIDLTEVAFTTGITFTFPAGTTLAAGSRILVVDDMAAFDLKYGTGHPVAGQYTGQLDNGGEQLVLEDHNGTPIKDFAYGDDSPWPESADGLGFSLVLIAPQENPAHGDPFNWRPSVAADGTPGTSDSVAFSGIATDDLDADNISALMEHALASSDSISDSSVLPTFASDTHFSFTYRHNLAADDLIYTVEISNDVTTWSSDPTDVVFVSSVNSGNGYALVTYRSALPIGSEVRQFMRLKVMTR